MTYILNKKDGYTFLRDTNYLIMSDAPEITKYYTWLEDIKSGSVLITGLGIGFCVKELLKKPNITSVTVIEKEPEIIDLVFPLFNDKRLHIKQGDAWEIESNKVFDFMIHDIWMYRGEATEKEINISFEKYKHLAKNHYSPFKINQNE